MQMHPCRAEDSINFMRALREKLVKSGMFCDRDSLFSCPRLGGSHDLCRDDSYISHRKLGFKIYIIRKTASKHSKPEPDAHSSRQIVEEEEQADESGLENLTDGQRRVEIEKRRRAMKDQRDARFHPKCKTLTEQINAANNAHAKYVALLTAAACESRY